MTAKEYLSQAFLLDRKIKSKERQLESLRAHAGYVSPSISDMPKGSPSRQSLVEETAVRILSLEEHITEQIAELVRLKKGIAEAISRVNNPEYETILEMRYLSFMQWEEITDRMGYGSNYVFEIHRKALRLIKFQ
jgi:DNA-directed RNA polymerase specialized sigma subunit